MRESVRARVLPALPLLAVCARGGCFSSACLSFPSVGGDTREQLVESCAEEVPNLYQDRHWI